MMSLRVPVDLYGVSMVVMDLYRVSMGHCGVSTGLYGVSMVPVGPYGVSMRYLWVTTGFYGVSMGSRESL